MTPRAWSTPTGCRRTASRTAPSSSDARSRPCVPTPLAAVARKAEDRAKRIPGSSLRPVDPTPARRMRRVSRVSSAGSLRTCRSSRGILSRSRCALRRGPECSRSSSIVSPARVSGYALEPFFELAAATATQAVRTLVDADDRGGVQGGGVRASQFLPVPRTPARAFAPRQPGPAVMAGGGPAQASSPTSFRSTSPTTPTLAPAWRRTSLRPATGRSGSWT